MVVDCRFMPLFMGEYFVIALNPNGPQRDVPEEVPNFDIFAVFLRD